MQVKKKFMSKKYLTMVLLVLLSIPVPLQGTSKANSSTPPLKVKIGDTKTYEVTEVSGGAAYGIYNTSTNTFNRYNLVTGIKYTVKVTSLNWNPYQYMGLSGYYNIIMTQKDNTNVTATTISIFRYDYVPFLISGFDTQSAASNFVGNYSKDFNAFNLDFYSPDHAFQSFMSPLKVNNGYYPEIEFIYQLDINGGQVNEYNYFNLTTGWLNKCILQKNMTTGGTSKVVNEVEILPIDAISKSASGLQASVVVLVLALPALLVLERRKRNRDL